MNFNCIYSATLRVRFASTLATGGRSAGACSVLGECPVEIERFLLDCTKSLTEELSHGKRLRMLAIDFHGLKYILVQNTRIHCHSNIGEESGEPWAILKYD